MSTDGVQSRLEGVVAFATDIAEPNRDGGALRYRGIDLSGPLHGGAPARVLKMLDEVEADGDPEAWVKRKPDRVLATNVEFWSAKYVGAGPRSVAQVAD